MAPRRPLPLAAAALVAAAAWPAPAQSGGWPTRSITLVVPFAASGPTDVVARTLGATMKKSLGQTVVIENRTGAGSTLAAGAVAKEVLACVKGRAAS